MAPWPFSFWVESDFERSSDIDEEVGGRGEVGAIYARLSIREHCTECVGSLQLYGDKLRGC